MKSAIYEGNISHVRFYPKKHKFNYKIFMTYLDLDELGKIFTSIPLWSDKKKSIAYFNRSDYLKPNELPLQDIVRQIIFNKTSCKHSGPIRVLTNLRILGCCFNPVTFYYCFNQADTSLDFVISEITNTPWNERHQYLVDLRNNEQVEFAKAFHISPFMDMDMLYNWQFTMPADSLNVKMKASKQQCYFKANLIMNRKEINKQNMLKLLLQHSLINYKVIWGIYWQATKLYLKRIPFYEHPKFRNNEKNK